MPDCGEYEEALVATRYFYLTSTRQELKLSPAATAAQKGDYHLLSLGPRTHPARVEDDGILKVGTFAEPRPRLPANWDDLSLDQTTEYTACTEPPSIIPPSMVRLMRYVDRIKEQCTISVSNDCARVLFKFADADSSKKINAAEIRKAVGSMLMFAELSEVGAMSDKMNRKIISRAKTEAEKITHDLFTRYDADSSKDLDFNELMQDFTAPKLTVIKEVLTKAGKTLPAFAVAASTLPDVIEVEVDEDGSPVETETPAPAKPAPLKRQKNNVE